MFITVIRKVVEFLIQNLDWIVPAISDLILFLIMLRYVNACEVKHTKSEISKTRNASLAFVSLILRASADCKVCIKRMEAYSLAEKKVLEKMTPEEKEKWYKKKESPEYKDALKKLRDDPFRLEDMIVETYMNSNVENATKLLDAYLDLKGMVQNQCFDLWDMTGTLNEEVKYYFSEVEKRIEMVESMADELEKSLNRES